MRIAEVLTASTGGIGRHVASLAPRLAADESGSVERGRRRLREQRQDLVTVPHGEVHALPELAYERTERRRRLREEPGLADPRCEAEEPPAEPVGERLPVTHDEPALLERLQRSRELALVAADELRQSGDTEAVRVLGVGEHDEHVEAAFERCRRRVHARTST